MFGICARGTKSFIPVLINRSLFSSCSQVKILFAIDSIVASCVQLLLPDALVLHYADQEVLDVMIHHA